MITKNNCHDISNNKFNFFNKKPLHVCRNRKFHKVFTNKNENNLNNTNLYLDMKLKELLDKAENEKNKIKFMLEDKKNDKMSIDSYINSINLQYDHLYINKLNEKIMNPFETPVYNIPRPIAVKKTKINIDTEINNIKDLLDIIKENPIKIEVSYNINMQALHNIKVPLNNLNNMIGMNDLKSSIVDQILYFVQDLHKSNNSYNNNIDFMHTVIYGPPGTGKTEIANILGDVFSNLGILKNRIFKKVTRSELIAGYLGQTALKTKDVIKSCLGGCLFIDEAYALGNSEKRDSFAKECIDTLCEALSFHKSDLMVIIAGYEKELKDCFFAYNSGLESRFTWRFNTDNYNAKELNQIFHKKVFDIGWSFSEDVEDKWFENKMDYFKYFGRDIETLLAKTKICHSRRVFCKEDSFKRKINIKDLDNGFKKFIENDEVKNRKNTSVFTNMYL